MSVDHELEPTVREWLRTSLERIPEPAHRYPSVAADVNSTPQQRPWWPQLTPPFGPVFRATRFMLAGVIVALFGGLLLAGVVIGPGEDQASVGAPSTVGSSAEAAATTARPASAEPEPDGGASIDLALETEEVAPGISLVVGDGVDGHVFARLPRDRRGRDHLLALEDGSVWLGLSGQRPFELGKRPESDRTHGSPWGGSPSARAVTGSAVHAVGHGGTTWFADDDTLQAFEDGRWVERGGEPRRSVYGRDPSRRPRSISDIAIHPDGSLWVVANGTSPLQEDGLHEVVSVERLGSEGWTVYQGREELDCPECEGQLEITPDGTVWVGLHDASGPGTSSGPDGAGGLRRFDGESWETVRPPGIEEDLEVVALEVNADGVLWVEFAPRFAVSRRSTPFVLARYDDAGWAVFDELERGLGWLQTVDAAGRAWLIVDHDSDGYPVAFDGSTLTRFEELTVEEIPGFDYPSERIEVAASPDGTVWVISGGRLFRTTRPEGR